MLSVINKAMSALDLNYAFMEWKGDPVYPYWTGEYQEEPTTTEDGLQNTSFILSGWHRGSWADLEKEKQKIENYFNKVSGKTVITESGSAVAVFYSHSLVVPTGDAELKKVEVYLMVKEWKVI